MPSLTTRQTLGYVAVAVLIIAIGWRYHAGAAADTPPSAGPAPAVADPRPVAASPVVVVDVSGAVRRPGVYRLPAGARVQDAVRRARPGPKADVSTVNLAARLTDGEQIVVPRRGVGGPDAAAASAAAGASSGGVVSINSGTLEQLETLDGIGPALAQRIVDYRTAHGGFRSLAELDQVSGIGPGRLAALRGHVSL
jgi:competence protein ComEA